METLLDRGWPQDATEDYVPKELGVLIRGVLAEFFLWWGELLSRNLGEINLMGTAARRLVLNEVEFVAVRRCGKVNPGEGFPFLIWKGKAACGQGI